MAHRYFVFPTKKFSHNKNGPHARMWSLSASADKTEVIHPELILLFSRIFNLASFLSLLSAFTKK